MGANELLYFADVCAGPGGFSEYVLWRKKWDCKGFGFTLKGPCDFKLGEFFAAHSELFEPHYGEFCSALSSLNNEYVLLESKLVKSRIFESQMATAIIF